MVLFINFDLHVLFGQVEIVKNLGDLALNREYEFFLFINLL